MYLKVHFNMKYWISMIWLKISLNVKMIIQIWKRKWIVKKQTVFLQEISIPSPDISSLIENLESLKSNIYKSFPNSRWGSSRDAFCYRRVKTHLDNFTVRFCSLWLCYFKFHTVIDSALDIKKYVWIFFCACIYMSPHILRTPKIFLDLNLQVVCMFCYIL